MRNRRELHASLKGATLGDADEDVDDTLKWVKKSKKKEKELARKRQEDFANRDKETQDYTERESIAIIRHIAKLTIFQVILLVSRSAMTLTRWTKAKRGYLRSKIVEFLTMKVRWLFFTYSLVTHYFPEDELQNVEMAEEERRKQRQETKIKKRDYTGYDDEEFTEGNQGLMKRSVLAKYDEDIEGPRTTVS